jgi:hypothetical protein
LTRSIQICNKNWNIPSPLILVSILSSRSQPHTIAARAIAATHDRSHTRSQPHTIAATHDRSHRACCALLHLAIAHNSFSSNHVHHVQFSSQKEADDHYAAAVAATPKHKPKHGIKNKSAKKTKVCDRPKTIQQREALKKPGELAPSMYTHLNLPPGCPKKISNDVTPSTSSAATANKSAISPSVTAPPKTSNKCEKYIDWSKGDHKSFKAIIMGGSKEGHCQTH